MYRLFTAAGLAALTLGVAACGGYNSSSPTSPDTGSVAPPGAIVIDIVRENGARSFSPNPATVPPGQTVVWHNIDTTTHRVVLDDRGVDTGNIAPGRFSAVTTLGTPGPYHCSIHPSMTGTVTSTQ